MKEALPPPAVIELALHHSRRGEMSKAVRLFESALLTCRPDPELYAEAVFALEQSNRTQGAILLADRARTLFPGEGRFEVQAALMLPVLYQGPEEVERYRARYRAGLAAVAAGVDLRTPEGRHRALAAIGQHVSFYLGYQGGCVRDLQEQYGRLLYEVASANYPDWARPLAMPRFADGRRIRIGYVSAHFRNHSVEKLFRGWLQEHDRSTFEVFAYHNGRTCDHVTEAVQRSVEHFRHVPGQLEPLCEAVLADRLHILVFLDVRHSRMALASSLRLAPVQCLAWACPITSGSPNMDYFLSGDAMEPEDGATHYSERLVRLPGIGVCYPRPVIPRPLFRKRRVDFGLGEDRTVYLCCQSIFKYLPQHDDMFVAIAERDPSAQFVFLAMNDMVAEDFRCRLRRAFAARNLDAAFHSVVLLPLGELDYWNLNVLSDVFLDSLGWSGGVTTLEAIACGLPIVTLPGPLMRGRHTLGILTQLGVTDTVARDKEEYADIAVRLAKDPAWRAEILERMSAGHPRLYGDTACVRALEDFYRDTVTRALP